MKKQTAAGAFKVSEDSTLGMLDVLEEEQQLQDRASAVLGGSDDKNCTYSRGYVKRQALYACSTCVTPNMEPAGVCLACSYACHEGHKLYELYTKRNFRCDCGNRKFPNNPCQLCPIKDSINVKNKYNQNFWGKYCICKRPYPDPEDNQPDEMLQCIICEDWYHEKHLGNDFIDATHDYSEMVCADCTKTLEFLWDYTSEAQNIKREQETNAITDKIQYHRFPQNIINGKYKSTGYQSATSIDTSVEAFNSNWSKTSLMSPVKKRKGKEERCLLKKLQGPSLRTPKGCTFWPEGWRKKLCRCFQCLQLYRNHSCLYLIDEEDTVNAYEEQGKEINGRQPQYEKALSALQGFDRVTQVELIHGFNNMSGELREYLKKFAESKKVVREKDIEEFFSQVKVRKRRRTK